MELTTTYYLIILTIAILVVVIIGMYRQLSYMNQAFVGYDILEECHTAGDMSTMYEQDQYMESLEQQLELSQKARKLQAQTIEEQRNEISDLERDIQAMLNDWPAPCTDCTDDEIAPSESLSHP